MILFDSMVVYDLTNFLGCCLIRSARLHSAVMILFSGINNVVLYSRVSEMRVTERNRQSKEHRIYSSSSEGSEGFNTAYSRFNNQNYAP